MVLNKERMFDFMEEVKKGIEEFGVGMEGVMIR